MSTPTQSGAIPGQNESLSPLFQLMLRINRVTIKAFEVRSLESLIFVMVNDTASVIRYDRAHFWSFIEGTPKLMGISGQVAVSRNTEASQKWKSLIQKLKDPGKAQQVNAESFLGDGAEWNTFQKQSNSSVVWLPLFVKEQLCGGLWLERWETQGEQVSPEIIDLLMNFLMKGYAVAWEKFTSTLSLVRASFGRRIFLFSFILLLLALFLIRVPLRIVGQCEVVPLDPILVTAPLEGIIEEVKVHPGENVEKGQLIVAYDKRVPLQNLKIAEKELQIAEADEARARALGYKDPKSLADLAILELKAEKERVKLDLAQYNASLLEIKATESGVATIDNPDNWRGKPVQVGEKILTISNPNQTKVKIWIAENDNILVDPNANISVYLNVNPEKNRPAKLLYIANESIVNQKNLASFIAEAEWTEHPTDIKLGLKGTAVLYGEKVSLFYFIMRKPWASFRNFFGV